MKESLENKNSKRMLFWITLGIITICNIVNFSYAAWKYTETQNDFDVLKTRCFELTMVNESEGITLEKVTPTKDEEGKKSSGYTFTIKNTCDTNAMYQVNLEELIPKEKRLSGKYIKVSLNNSNGKILNTYEPVNKTLENADTSHKLTSGSLKKDEEVTYILKLWMDESTPPLDEVMNATFESKVTIIATYKEDLTNEINIIAKSKNEEYQKTKETFEVTATSEYDLIEISLDGETWHPIKPTKEYQSEYTFEKEGIYTIYIKDELGNMKACQINTSMLDQTPPKIKNITESPSSWTKESVTITIEEATDSKSGLNDLAYSFDNGVSWQKENTKTYEENESNIIIKVRDALGNTYTHEKINITKIDKTAPVITSVSGNSNNWTSNVTLTIIGAKDEGIGLEELAYSFDNGSTWQSENTKIYKENEENIIIKVRDALGNTYTHEGINITKIDNTPPTITNISVNPTSWTKENVTLTINNITDTESGIGEQPYSFDNGETWQTNNQKTYTENTENIQIKVRDKVGNLYTHEAINITKIDKTPPTLKISATTSLGTITVSASGSNDSQSGIKEYQYSRDNKNWYTSTSQTYTFTGLNDGSYTVYVKAKDNVGNTSGAVNTTAVVAYQNVYVSSSGNDTTGNGSSSSPYATINKAYTRVGSGYNIILLSNITQTSTASFNEANKSVNLKSNGSNIYNITRGNNLKSSIINVSNKNTLTTTNITFNGNNVASTDSVINISGTSTFNLNSNATIKGGKNSNYGGGIRVTGISIFNMNGGLVTGNTTSDHQGGGVHIMGNSTMNLNSGTISNNSSTNTEYGQGGGIFVWLGTLNLKGGSITGNTVTESGGGIWIAGGPNGTTTVLNITGNCNISSNTAKYHGGGIYIGVPTKFTMSNGTVSNNTAESGGGGIFIRDQGGSGTITGGTIFGNKSPYGAGVVAYEYATLTIGGGNIHNNTATTAGGGIQCDVNATCTINNGNITGNTAEYGGGVTVWHNSTLYLKGGTIENNTATLNGGGVDINGSSHFYLQGGNVINNKCNVSNNVGGIAVTDDAYYHYSSGAVYGNTPKDTW